MAIEQVILKIDRLKWLHFFNNLIYLLLVSETKKLVLKGLFDMTKYGVIVGSIRKNSYSKGVAEAIVAGLPDDAEVTYLNIAKLPLYNQDYDADSPVEYTEFRQAVAAQDAFIFVTPEHNRSIPAALKNALDVASRPWGQSVWGGKPALVASQSISGISGVLAHHVLRQSLVFLDMPTMQQPELYIGNTDKLADENGHITNEGTQSFLAGAGKQFSEFAAKFVK
ncbi:Flavin reductase [Lactiplantibacillus plantarum]|nr:putative NAD(P)H dehydrogenase (Quinone) [Lactiplantibacillus plantarum subsp. plantarum P-8]EFK30607.1 flavin reductase [Lactiplantibacillus plantarum subsp. plantarum ATCC 14917 = JCM 1149 = CGMCC 1.2437]ERJ47877.1 ACP phosphodiesterase [Lactiplantibacillus plantarum 2165]EYR71373.1 ACP phosphodiesterase [Lactiplantibacillus plantarum WHE 92]KFL87296.1 putative oxidoreductase (putative) [Lactiplantibacillus plantarum]